MVINNILSYITFAIGAIIMKLDTTKLEALNTKEVTEIEGGGAWKMDFQSLACGSSLNTQNLEVQKLKQAISMDNLDVECN